MTSPSAGAKSLCGRLTEADGGGGGMARVRNRAVRGAWCVVRGAWAFACRASPSWQRCAPLSGGMDGGCMAVHGRAKQGRRGTGRLCLPTRSFLARSLTDTHAKPVRCRVCLAVECAFSLCPSLLCPTASPGSGPRVLSALARRAVERRWGAGGRGGRLGRLRGRRRTGQSTHGIVSRKDHLRSGKNATRSRKQSDSAGAVAPRARPSQFAAGDYSRCP